MPRLNEQTGELAWCVVETVGGKEALLASEIVRVGLSAYWPRYPVMMRANSYSPNKKKRVMKSLFPGYVFAGFIGQTWRRVCGLPGGRQVLEAGFERPALIPLEFLRRLLGSEPELAHNLARARRAFGFKVGDQVRIVDGPFQGLYAKLRELDDDGRISILLDILGGATPISRMRADQVEAA